MFITIGLLYNSNEHWPPVIYMKWGCEFRNRHLVSGVAKQNSISSGWARRDSPCHPASHTQLPLGQHWEIGFNIDYFLSRWGVWIIDPSDVLSLTLPENITVQLSVARGLCVRSLFEHADSKKWGSSEINSNKAWHSYDFYHFPLFILSSLVSSEQIATHFGVINFY